MFSFYSFYRYVLEPRVSFDVASQLWSGPQALFTNLSQKPILTLFTNLPHKPILTLGITCICVFIL